jgi:DNA-binding Lrp family transcriptional regulator
LQAYVLIQTEDNREPIAEVVRGIPGVLTADDLTGPYDAIALARSDSTRSLANDVVSQIQELPGVIRALSAPLIGSLGQVPAAEPRVRVEAA